jgi:hypothetical protein
MARLFGGKIIAVDVIPDADLAAEGDPSASISGWNYAWKRANPLAKSPGMPSILSILMRSVTSSTQGLRRARELSEMCVLYLRPAVSRWNLLDFRAAEPVAEEAHRATYDAIAAWWKKDRGVVLPPPGNPA